MGQDDRIHLGRLEHVDVLALLLFIRYIINRLVLLLFLCVSFSGLVLCFVYNLCLYLFTVFIGCSLRTFFLFHLIRIGLVDLKTLGQSHVFAVQVLKENIICHLLTEFIVL